MTGDMDLVDVHHRILPSRFVAEPGEEILDHARSPGVLAWTPARAVSHGGGLNARCVLGSA